MRIFQLHRDEDSSGVSGTGIVAEGIEFTNRECVIHWLSKRSSVCHYTNIDDVVAIHGHEGRTRVVFVEPTTIKKPAEPYVAPETPCGACGASPRGPLCPIQCNEQH